MFLKTKKKLKYYSKSKNNIKSLKFKNNKKYERKIVKGGADFFSNLDIYGLLNYSFNNYILNPFFNSLGYDYNNINENKKFEEDYTNYYKYILEILYNNIQIRNIKKLFGNDDEELHEFLNSFFEIDKTGKALELKNEIEVTNTYFKNKNTNIIINDKTKNNLLLKYYEDTKNNLIELYKKYRFNRQINLIHPDFHGAITENYDIKRVPNNCLFCFFTPLGSVGMSNDDILDDLVEELSNITTGELETILYKLSNLCDTSFRDVEIMNELSYLDCYINATWYYPLQQYYDLDLATDINSNIKYTRKFGINNTSSKLKKYNEDINFEIKLSDFIQKESLDNFINIYFFRVCRPFTDVKPNTIIKYKNRCDNIFKYEFFIHHTNMGLSKVLLKNNIVSSVDDIKTFNCNYQSEKRAFLYTNKIRYQLPIINTNYKYNRISIFIIEFCNRFVYDKLTNDFIYYLIHLSINKQIFILNLCYNYFINNNTKFEKLLNNILFVLSENNNIDNIFTRPFYIYDVLHPREKYHTDDYYITYKLELTQYLDNIKSLLESYQSNHTNISNLKFINNYIQIINNISQTQPTVFNNSFNIVSTNATDEIVLYKYYGTHIPKLNVSEIEKLLILSPQLTIVDLNNLIVKSKNVHIEKYIVFDTDYNITLEDRSKVKSITNFIIKKCEFNKIETDIKIESLDIINSNINVMNIKSDLLKLNFNKSIIEILEISNNVSNIKLYDTLINKITNTNARKILTLDLEKTNNIDFNLNIIKDIDIETLILKNICINIEIKCINLKIHNYPRYKELDFKKIKNCVNIEFVSGNIPTLIDKPNKKLKITIKNKDALLLFRTNYKKYKKYLIK